MSDWLKISVAKLIGEFSGCYQKHPEQALEKINDFFQVIPDRLLIKAGDLFVSASIYDNQELLVRVGKQSINISRLLFLLIDREHRSLFVNHFSVIDTEGVLSPVIYRLLPVPDYLPTKAQPKFVAGIFPFAPLSLRLELAYRYDLWEQFAQSCDPKTGRQIEDYLMEMFDYPTARQILIKLDQQVNFCWPDLPADFVIAGESSGK